MTPVEDDSNRSISQDSESVRFLFVTVPVTGHVSPLLPVAKKLSERGHEVVWYTSARFQRRIEGTGAKSVPYQLARDLDYDRLNELFPERAQLKGLAQSKWDLKRLVIDIGVEQAGELLTILRESKSQVLVGDSMAFAALLVAEQTNVPLAMIGAFPLFAPSRDTAPAGLGILPSGHPFGRIRNRFLNWLVYRAIMRDVNAHFNDARTRLGLPPVSEPLLQVPLMRSALFMQPTIPAFEYPRSDLPEHFHYIGALLPDGVVDFAEPDWWGELAEDRPVVLVTQGTIATDFNQLIIPAIRGLADENALVIATTGNKSVGEIGLESLPGNVRLEPFVPFAHLMPHVDVMVTNGGYGGTHYALVHGVPLVAGGITEDKAEICARIGWSGVGINLKTNSPAPEAIRGAVRTVLTEPTYKEKARVMQSGFARLDAPTKAAEMLEDLAMVGQRLD